MQETELEAADAGLTRKQHTYTTTQGFGFENKGTEGNLQRRINVTSYNVLHEQSK